MAETTAVFDEFVFDTAFATYDIIPVIFKVKVARQYTRIALGQSVPISIYIIDNTTSPHRQFPFNPSVGPFITIYDPLNTVVVLAAAVPLTEQGIFTYMCDTLDYTELGVYSATFAAENGEAFMISKRYAIFTAV